MLIWYLARGAGISAFAMLTLATAAGALTSGRGGSIGRRLVVQYVHRSAALTGLALLALHIGTILADRFAGVGVAGALLPLASGYRPMAVSFGVLATYLLVAATVTGLLRSRFARSAAASRRWRGIHLAGYAAWAASAWHFYTAGTDARQWWAWLVLLAGIWAVAGGLLGRLVRPAVPSGARPNGPSSPVGDSIRQPVLAGQSDPARDRQPAQVGGSR